MSHPFGQLAQMTPEQVAALPPAEFARLVALVDAEQSHFDRSMIYRLYPEDGPVRRELYVKHMQHFAAGKFHQERALIGGNRTGKTAACSYEIALHMMGWYPDWWIGRRFDSPVLVWAAGEDSKAVRESLQVTYLGRPGEFGTGLIPQENLIGTTARSGVPEAIDTFTVKHRGGRPSRLLFKSYDQGRESFQASKIDIMQFDEEPPVSIYTEGMTRTMSTVPGRPSGMVICGFTPLKGLSGVVLSYLPGGTPKEGAVG